MAHDEGPRAREHASAPKKDRRATRIVGVLVVAALMIAVGGTTAMILLRRAAPNDAFEMIVTPTLPLVVGDRVNYVARDHTCSAVPVIGLEHDGRVTIVGCEGAARPVTVSRAMLRVARFPHQNGAMNPEIGDIVLVLEQGQYTRAEIVASEPAGRIRIRALPASPDARDVAASERSVDQATAVLVRRRGGAAAPHDVPVGAAAR